MQIITPKIIHIPQTFWNHLKSQINLKIFRIIKPNRCTKFVNLFLNENLHFSDSSSIENEEFFTAHTAVVYVIQASCQLASRITMELELIP